MRQVIQPLSHPRPGTASDSGRTGVSSNSITPRDRARFFRGPGGVRSGWASVVAILGVLTIFSGCGPERAGARGSADPTRDTADAGSSLIDPGDEVFLDRASAQASRRIDRRMPVGSANASTSGRWSVLLTTVGGDGHPMQAAAIREQIVRDYPTLRGAFVRPQGRGSAVWFGRFASPSDADAQAVRAQVKAIERNGRPAFPQAFLAVLPDDSPIGEHDIRQLRLMYPTVEPLYSLQVACWGTFGGDQISFDEVKRSSEREVRDLRARGFDAWYHHDEVTGSSVVTIGVFDKRSYDGRSTLYAPEVEALMREFPIHRINGEEAMVEVVPGDRSSRVPQTCRLVSVPRIP